jgi:hypothetical protein
MKLTILCLFLLTAPFALASEPLTSPLYGCWLARETRESKDHWLTRVTYQFGTGSSGGPEIFVYTTCRTEGGVIQAQANSRVKLDANSFTVRFSEDELIRQHGRTCAAVLHQGTYLYQMSEDGESVLVGEGTSAVRWRRHENP